MYNLCLAVVAVLLLGILKQEGGLSHAAHSLDTNQPVIPVNLVHKVATYRGIGMLYKIGVCAEKCFHYRVYCIICGKDTYYLRICKAEFAKNHYLRGIFSVLVWW